MHQEKHDCTKEEAAQGEDLENVMQRNGDLEHLEKVIEVTESEDDPPLVFGWIHIDRFVMQAIAAPPVAPAAGGAAMMCPFALPVPLTVETFKTALLNYVREPVAATQPVGTSVIPGDHRQFAHAVSAVAELNSDPWFMAVAGSAAGLVPIAEVLIMSELMIGTAMSPHVKAAGARLWK